MKEDFLEDKEDYSTNITIKDPLIEPFFVIKDRYCFTLHMKTKTNPKYTVDGTSKDVIKTVGHFADLTSCLKRIAKEKVHFKKEYNSVMDYINEYNKISEEVKTYMKNIINEEH
jgi:hypothetical protein